MRPTQRYPKYYNPNYGWGGPNYAHVRHYHYRPWHGTVVYGPRPVHHHYYAGHTRNAVKAEHLPKRNVERAGSFAIGLHGGSYLSAYEGTRAYGDFGLGLNARWRPIENLGIDMKVMHQNETWTSSTERMNTTFQPSLIAFAWPWKRISPYVLGGLTWDRRRVDDVFYTLDSRVPGADVENLYVTSDTKWGPHVGLGLELAIGKSVAIDLDARFVGYVNRKADDPSLPGAVQTSAGLLVHF